MTPEEARALLDATRQGPQDGQRPVTVAAKYAPLAEAAYGLAQLVAGLRYEYAVQVEEKPGVWRYLHSSGESTGFSTAACWCKNLEMAPYPLAKYRHRETTPSRIVRRLVSEPEVAE